MLAPPLPRGANRLDVEQLMPSNIELHIPRHGRPGCVTFSPHFECFKNSGKAKTRFERPGSSSWSQASDSSGVSMVSCPPRYAQDNCFPPQVTFQRADGGRVRAEQLCTDGGDVLIGSAGRPVTVRSATKIGPRDFDVIRLTVENVVGTFSMEVTADHGVMTRGPNGDPIAVEARELIAQPRDMFDGYGFQPLKSAQLPRISTNVVRVALQEPGQCLLAWLLPRGRRQPKSLIASASFCCQGSPHTYMDLAKKIHTTVKRILS